MWTCSVPLRKRIQVGVIDLKCFLLFKVSQLIISVLVSPEFPSLIKKKPAAAKKTVCPVTLFCPSQIETIHAVSLCSWLPGKVAWVLRRLADRISLSWRRRLKLSTSSESRRNLQLLTK